MHFADPVSGVSSSSSNGTQYRPFLDILIGILCAAAWDLACLYGLRERLLACRWCECLFLSRIRIVLEKISLSSM
jgi:hypothetical protein